ncbi:MAG TPA: hypothetical protein VFJ58_24605, partial [Armatimonadota bacterium]|nr:hypothetical protein [Armatimonadota bacterium]
MVGVEQAKTRLLVLLFGATVGLAPLLSKLEPILKARIISVNPDKLSPGDLLYESLLGQPPLHLLINSFQPLSALLQ